MSTNILLAVDVVAGRRRTGAWAAAQLARDLVRGSADHVVVVYVREFSIRQIGRMVADHGGAVGQHAVNEIVAGLRDAGIQASGLVREADGGHVGQVIAEAARDIDARVIVLGSGRHVSWPHLPLGSVATRVLHLAVVPVLVVPSPERRAGAAIPVPLATANEPRAARDALRVRSAETGTRR
jgi:nucleotide-binding universal stress UspA family protein